MQKHQEINLALAAVCQATSLVKQVAHSGKADEESFQACIRSIVLTNPSSTLEVYGELKNVKLGYEALVTQLSHKPFVKDSDITRYITGILNLERRLNKRSQSMQELANRIEDIHRQEAHFDLYSPQMIRNLASIYSDVISPVGAKIQVIGEPEHIQQPQVQNKIRALLLAAVRSAVLWRQLGGQRRQILFKRRAMMDDAQQVLTQLS